MKRFCWGAGFQQRVMHRERGSRIVVPSIERAELPSPFWRRLSAGHHAFKRVDGLVEGLRRRRVTHRDLGEFLPPGLRLEIPVQLGQPRRHRLLRCRDSALDQTLKKKRLEPIGGDDGVQLRIGWINQREPGQQRRELLIRTNKAGVATINSYASHP